MWALLWSANFRLSARDERNNLADIAGLDPKDDQSLDEITECLRRGRWPSNPSLREPARKAAEQQDVALHGALMLSRVVAPLLAVGSAAGLLASAWALGGLLVAAYWLGVGLPGLGRRRQRVRAMLQREGYQPLT